MKSLATAFKEVYGEALKEYGFKKVKSKYPYYARMVGDEIVQVITYKEEWCAAQNKKAFSVMGGIATIYRKKITLDINPKDCIGWLCSNADIYFKNNMFNYDDEYRARIMKFEYEKNDELCMLESLKWSLDITKTHIIKEFEQVLSIVNCYEYYLKFNPNLLFLYLEEEFGVKYNSGEYNEGLLNYLVCSLENYVEYKTSLFEKNSKYQKHLIDTGKSGWSYEEYEMDRKHTEQLLLDEINRFVCMISENNWKMKVEAELEERKNNNKKYLKKII